MAVPKKKKININVNPPKPGNEYLKYGFERIEKLMNDADPKTKFVPRTIEFFDLDLSIKNYTENTLDLTLDGKKVPVFYLENERWGEFSKTWKFTDNDKNVPTPYITVRRSGKENGTRLGGKYRVAQNRKFRYYDVPILDDGEIIFLRFKTPEPINVDLIYDVNLFTKYRVDVNVMDELILKKFASLQEYVFVKGLPFPVLLESIDETNNIENIDGDKYIVGKYKFRLKGAIQKEEEFEITKTFRKTKISTNIV